eukprot:c9933_g1_i3.p1 GENE.c9933_g1_i3~~c9933_g1_i3.p1  ORF type:complete len:245 (-),score=62.57 c9933_g1_i3:139-873(-)
MVSVLSHTRYSPTVFSTIPEIALGTEVRSKFDSRIRSAAKEGVTVEIIHSPIDVRLTMDEQVQLIDHCNSQFVLFPTNNLSRAHVSRISSVSSDQIRIFDPLQVTELSLMSPQRVIYSPLTQSVCLKPIRFGTVSDGFENNLCSQQQKEVTANSECSEIFGPSSVPDLLFLLHQNGFYDARASTDPTACNIPPQLNNQSKKAVITIPSERCAIVVTRNGCSVISTAVDSMISTQLRRIVQTHFK